MSGTTDLEVIQRAWEARERGDLAAMREAFAPDARWRGIEDGPWNCESRSEILRFMERHLQDDLLGRIEEATELGSRVMVGFRPERAPENRPLDDGIAYVVLTMRDGRIVEMKGCADRAGALAYARSGQPA